MNREQKKRVRELRDKVENLKLDLLSLREDTDEIRSEESDKYYNLPESLQEGKVGQALQDSEWKLDDIIQCFDQVEIEFDSLLESFDDLIG